MSRRAKRERIKAARRERFEQAEADTEAREDWLAAVHGERGDLELLAGDTRESKAARDAVLRASEVPDGTTHAMLRAACQRALESM